MGKILRYNTVTTRKPHFCFGCGRKFQSPCKMISAAFTDCGSVSSYYLCMTCDSIVSDVAIGRILSSYKAIYKRAKGTLWYV